MKKQVLVILVLLFSLSMSAQHFTGGLVAGPVASQVDGDLLGGYNKAALMGGLWVAYKLEGNWSAQFEISYIQKGSRRWPKTDQGDYSEYYMKLNYIDFPLMAVYKVMDKLKAKVGLVPAYLIDFQEGDEYGDFESDASRPYKKVNLAAIAAVNYELNKHFSVEARAARDLIPFRPHVNNQTAFLDYGQYNRWLEFCLVYQFK